MSPERTCVGCRKRGQQDVLMRVVAQVGGLVVGRNLPGRGAWLHPNLACLELAERRSAFGRALRASGPLDAAGIRSHLEGLDPSASAV